MDRFLGVLIGVLALLYVVALLLLAIGTFGWFGAERDPLSGIFLIPLGLPWTLMLGAVRGDAVLWLGLLAPLVNIALLVWLRRAVVRRGR